VRDFIRDDERNCASSLIGHRVAVPTTNSYEFPAADKLEELAGNATLLSRPSEGGSNPSSIDSGITNRSDALAAPSRGASVYARPAGRQLL